MIRHFSLRAFSCRFDIAILFICRVMLPLLPARRHAIDVFAVIFRLFFFAMIIF